MWRTRRSYGSCLRIAVSVKGRTLGILPGPAREDGNGHVDAYIPIGLSYRLGNYISVRGSDGLILIHCNFGVLCKPVFAYQHSKQVIALSSTGGLAGGKQNSVLDEVRSQ